MAQLRTEVHYRERKMELILEENQHLREENRSLKEQNGHLEAREEQFEYQRQAD